MLSISLPFFLSFGFAVGPGVCWSVGMVELRPEISWATSKAVPGRHGDLHRGTTTEEDLRGSKKRSKIMKIWGNHENILKHTVEHTVDYSRLLDDFAGISEDSTIVAIPMGSLQPELCSRVPCGSWPVTGSVAFFHWGFRAPPQHEVQTFSLRPRWHPYGVFLIPAMVSPHAMVSIKVPVETSWRRGEKR